MSFLEDLEDAGKALIGKLQVAYATEKAAIASDVRNAVAGLKAEVSKDAPVVEADLKAAAVAAVEAVEAALAEHGL